MWSSSAQKHQKVIQLIKGAGMLTSCHFSTGQSNVEGRVKRLRLRRLFFLPYTRLHNIALSSIVGLIVRYDMLHKGWLQLRVLAIISGSRQADPGFVDRQKIFGRGNQPPPPSTAHHFGELPHDNARANIISGVICYSRYHKWYY